MIQYNSKFLSCLPKRTSKIKDVEIHLTERHLQILWLKQSLLKCLMTDQGENIEVISPGIWNKEAGPDFLKAHLRIGQRDYRGDVEIHLDDEGWYQHGHHCDPRYNQVILHLSYRRSLHPISINKENGQQVFSCQMKESFAIPLDHLFSSADFDSGKQFHTRGRCAENLFKLLSDKEIENFFKSAAYWRLEKKLIHLEQICADRSMQFAGGIAMALGYRHNAKPFLDLFFYITQFRELSYDELLAIALGCCGFLEDGRRLSWEGSDYYQKLRLFWWGNKSRMIHQTVLKLDHIRPLHHPIRRLAYLTHLLQDPLLEELWPQTLRIWKREMDVAKPNFKRLKEHLLQILPLYHDSYWDHHYTFESSAQTKSLPTLGSEVKMHLLLNTTLPLLYAMIRESGDVQAWEKFQQFYSSLEMAQNSKSLYLHRRFFDEQKDEKFFAKAQMMQGAYQLHQDFCQHFEASCEGCPFIERYQQRE